MVNFSLAELEPSKITSESAEGDFDFKVTCVYTSVPTNWWNITRKKQTPFKSCSAKQPLIKLWSALFVASFFLNSLYQEIQIILVLE